MPDFDVQIRLSSTLLKQRNRFHVCRMREQIDRLHHAKIVSILQKLGEIAGECGCIAGNIKNFLRLMSKDGGNDFGVEPSAWWIENDTIKRILTPRCELSCQYLFRSAFVEADVANLIFPCRFKRILHGGLFTLDSHHLLRKACKVLPDRADSTVTIEHGFPATKIGNLRNRLV